RRPIAVATVTEAPSVPPWGSVTGGTGWTPAPETGTATPPGGQRATEVTATVAPVVTADEDDDEDLDDEDLPRHPYTWLHMIALVLVAFVLGMLIFMVVLKDAGPSDPQGAAQVTEVVAAAWATLGMAA